MTEGNNLNTAGSRHPDALGTLTGILERALDSATSVVLMRHVPEVCTLYLGDPSGPQEELRRVGTIPSKLADEILQITSSGPNRVRIADQPYRFVRSFTQIGQAAAVVFSI